jgi:spermidine/putrescine transport system ATP-binding protein
MIAGFEQPDTGDVLLQGRSVVGVPAHRRPVNMVFQHYALFPHLDVFDNVAYGLRQTRPVPPRDDLRRQVAEALALVRLDGFERRRSWELSGGQQQRVALARALINRPTVLLLDEPLAALDRKLRREMQIELQTLQREVGITFVLVTHDQEEALSMSDTICIMRDGRIVQTGTPTELYDAPLNRYVADFVGRSNFIPGKTVAATDRTVRVRTASGLELTGRSPGEAAPPQAGAPAVIAVRPELVLIRAAGGDLGPDTNVAVPGRVRNRIYLGEQTESLVDADRLGEILVRAPKHDEATTGGSRAGDADSLGWRSASALALAD